MSDAVMEQSEVPADEPQFNISEQAAKPKRKNTGLIFLAVALVFALAAYIGSDMLKSKEPVASDEPATAAAEQANPLQSAPVNTSTSNYNVGFNPVDEMVRRDQRPVNPTAIPSTANPQQTNEAQSVPMASDVTVAVMQQLQILNEQLVKQNKRLQTLESYITQLDGKVGKSFETLVAGNVDIANTLKALGRDGQGRDTVLAEIESGIKGLKVDIQEQRQAFTINVLHIESWGGKKRVVAFDKGTPESVYKLFVGEVHGFWKLESIEGQKVVFLHEDGIVHEEVVM